MRVTKKFRKSGSSKRTRISFKVFNKRLNFNPRKRVKLHVNAVSNADVVLRKFRLKKTRKDVYRKPLCDCVQNEIVDEMRGLSVKRKFDVLNHGEDEMLSNVKRMKLENKLRKNDKFKNIFEFPIFHGKKPKLM